MLMVDVSDCISFSMLRPAISQDIITFALYSPDKVHDPLSFASQNITVSVLALVSEVLFVCTYSYYGYSLLRIEPPVVICKCVKPHVRRVRETYSIRAIIQPVHSVILSKMTDKL